MENSKISWCRHSLSFWLGCTKVSPGCENCFAERDMDKRFHRVKWGAGQPRVERLTKARKEAFRWNRNAEKTGVRPRVFVNPCADWLDPEVPIGWLVFYLLDTIRLCHHLDFLLLTKRPEQFIDRVGGCGQKLYDGAYPWLSFEFQDWIYDWFHGEPPTNVWIGATVENQEMADKRIPALLEIPASVHFLSCEPLLGALPGIVRPGIDWVICGGESGQNARPMHPDWARRLRDQCKGAGVHFFFKQWGEWVRCGMVEDEKQYQRQVLEGTIMCKVGMMAAGKLIDGDLDPVNHHEFPEGGPRE